MGQTLSGRRTVKTGQNVSSGRNVDTSNPARTSAARSVRFKDPQKRAEVAAAREELAV
jgi:hypothetical protein